MASTEAILELHGAHKRLTVPPGLRPLLEEMSIAVIRHQPTNIYMFLADFLDMKSSQRQQQPPFGILLVQVELDQSQMLQAMGDQHMNLEDMQYAYLANKGLGKE